MADSAIHVMPDVFVSDDSLFITDLVETDKDVVSLVQSVSDPKATVRQCLQIGARCMSSASPLASTLDVQRVFDELESKFNQKVDSAVGEVEAVTKKLLDDDEGALTKSLQAHQEGFDEVLGEHFDEDSKSSVYSLIKNIVSDALDNQTDKFRKTVSMDSADSPLRVMKKDIIEGFEKPIGDLEKQVQDISEKLAVDQAVAPVIAITSAKGFTFEERLHHEVSIIAGLHGDDAEHTGEVVGTAGNKKGDEVVILNTEDTYGVEACFALEAKTRKISSREAHSEMDDALENRDADAVILVFDSPEKSPSSSPFQYRGNKAMVSLADDDTSALKLAYMWARWITRRACEPAGPDSIDLDRVTEIIEKASRAVNRRSTIKSNHTKAINGIEAAQSIVVQMTTEIEELLTELGEVVQ